MNDNKNMIMAIALSILVMLGWPFIRDIIYPPPPPPPPGSQQPVAAAPQTPTVPASGDEAGVPTVTGTVAAAPTDIAQSRDEIIGAAPRIRISTPRLSGSINLRGARFDDLTLTDYHETIEDDSPQINLLQPNGGPAPYLVQYGWTTPGSLTLPDGDTIWSASAQTVSPGNPVTLSWTNPQGVTFEQVVSVDENFMFTVNQRITNGSGADVIASPYARIFRAEKPKTLGFYILHEGMLGVFNGVLEERDYDEVDEHLNRREELTTAGGWMGITDKYWLVALVPEQQTTVKAQFLSTGAVTSQYHVNYLTDPQTVAPGESAEQIGRVFAGAKETLQLDKYEETLGIGNFDLAVDFGWFYFLTKPIFYAIHWLHGVLGNFGLAILGLTVSIKMIFFPLANKSYRSMSKMKLLQPKIAEMREKAGDDKAKLQREMMELYKKEKVNPLAGCLPVIIQIPVFFSLYKVLFVTIEMRHAPFFGWIHDLSAPDPLGMLTLFGLIPWEIPKFLLLLNIGLWPLIMGFTMWFQQKLNPPPADPIQAKVFGLMPIFFTFILGGFPAGLVIYWAWNNSLSILQQYVIMRRMGVAIGGGKIKESGE